MEDSPFDQFIKDAGNKELQVRVAAIVASDVATCIVERIEAAAKGASQSFVDLMQPYLQRFKFYGGIRDELDRRCSARTQTVPYETAINAALPNIEMFGVIAAALEGSRLEVRSSYLVAAGEPPKPSRSQRLHSALHVVELVAASQSATHPIGHMIGPLLGLAIGVVERREHSDAQDVFLSMSKFLCDLEKIEEHMRTIAIGVYRVPDFWPTLRNVALQRERRKIKDPKSLDPRSPLSIEEAERALSAALVGHS